MQTSLPEPSAASIDAFTPQFLRIRSVIRLTGLGRSTIYRLIADQQFPRPVRLGLRAVAWRRADLDQWSVARPSAKH